MLSISLASELPATSYSQHIDKTQLNFTSASKVPLFYSHHASNLTHQDDKPWKRNPHYFKKVHLSLQALIKMTLHARLGGPLEIMGMLTGKYINNELVVMDCYALPVHGTESRVNPLNQAYEFMLKYLSSLQKNPNRSENIIGWYHSHPSFGCWLSGIDVQTQKLNQNFQDPYIAIVVDPVKSVRQKFIDIGCFRTYYDHNKLESNRKTTDVAATLGDTTKSMSSTKIKDFGYYADQYYSLEIDVFKTPEDTKILQLLESKYWFSGLCNLRSDDKIMKMQQWEELGKAMEHNSGTIFKHYKKIDLPALGSCESPVSKMKMFNKPLSELSSPSLTAAGSPRLTLTSSEDVQNEGTGKLLVDEFNGTCLDELKNCLIREVEEQLFS
ncbi:hypothetical protein FOA43_004637 [Brettanomyces nanus]|uniref:COP9 signalosome complex subunit 5 n=1 Tax=Eeniella nana TaxID=13502 RepID=A0A875RQK0_EENNA|nr:uncharacterized protein FOA43_004637 [Brettanomyces nanus]QPG77230.1 hypothetical protein FOA43_004637 [Brettanomyces nanus]